MKERKKERMNERMNKWMNDEKKKLIRNILKLVI